MLARELKSTFNKSLNEFTLFVVAQTFQGNSYTTKLGNEEYLEEYDRLSKKLLPVILSDNNLPPFMESDCQITGIKFNEQTDSKTGELIQMVQFTVHHFVEKVEKKGKIVYNYLKITLLNREYISLPDQTVRDINALQKFLNKVAVSYFESEPRQTKLPFSKPTSNSFEDLDQATQEITGSAASKEQIEGMQAATEEHLKKRSPKQANSIGTPVEITEDEEV